MFPGRMHARRNLRIRFASRLTICSTCPHVLVDGEKKPKTCSVCNCHLPSKTAIAAEECPQTRWSKTNEAVAFVQPARAGDILSILPAMRRMALRGHKVYHIVCKEYAPLVEGLSYVEPVVFDGSPHEVGDGIKVAEAIGAEPIPTQCWGNPNPIRSDNYQMEPWQRAGMPERFDREPLILDNRDAAAELRLYRQIVGDDKRPVVLINLAGNRFLASSPYPCKDWPEPRRLEARVAYFEWLRGRLEPRCKVVDLSEIHASRFQDLLGLFERSTALISVDTGTMHLGYASRTPTVGLVNDLPSKASLRRPHWIERLTYAESQTPEGGERIIAAVEAQLAKPRGPHIVHIVDDSWRPGRDTDDFVRLARAAGTWVGLPQWTTARIRDPKRTSESIGDTRRMPFVRDLCDAGCELAEPDDIVCFTNSDISIVPEAPDALRAALENAPCCYGPRTIVPALVAQKEPLLSRRKLQQFRPDACPLPSDGGTDLFAFRPEWWKQRRGDFPDMVLGCTWWDVVMVNLMRLDNPDAAVYPPVIWHEDHSQFWKRAENINDNPGQVHNRLLARKWLHDRPQIGLRVPDRNVA